MGEPGHTTRAACVLLVEDDEALCALLARALEAEGYRVVSALGNSAAYEAFGRDGEAFAAVVLDVDLGPGTTGFDLARFARARDDRLPVIFISGDMDAEASVKRFR